MEGYIDIFGIARQRFVTGIVQHLLDDVQRIVGARVHARALAHGFETFQDADGGFGVGGTDGNVHFSDVQITNESRLRKDAQGGTRETKMLEMLPTQGHQS